MSLLRGNYEPNCIDYTLTVLTLQDFLAAKTRTARAAGCSQSFGHTPCLFLSTVHYSLFTVFHGGPNVFASYVPVPLQNIHPTLPASSAAFF